MITRLARALFCAAGLAALADSAPAPAQTTASGQLPSSVRRDNGQGTPPAAVGIVTGSGGCGVVGSGCPLPVSDNGAASNNAPFEGAVAMAIGTPQTAQRSVGAYCSTAGTAVIELADTSTLTVPVSVGWQTFPFAAVEIVSVSGASCVWSNLK
jgi:hypothetical protein